jgi:hypothetical protein
MTLALLAAPARADHPGDVAKALDGLRGNDLTVAERLFQKDASRDGNDRLLALYELATCCHLAGDTGKSIRWFGMADDLAHDYEARAVVSAGAAARGAGAVLVNDKLLRYEGRDYEKILSRTINALNYLLQGDMEGARVELRKAEEYQAQERERHAKEVLKAQERPPKGTEAARMDNPAVAAAYGPMNSYVRNLRNAYEDAFTYYLSSRMYLVEGGRYLDDAMVEIRRAFELAPDAPAVRAAYRETARAQGGPALDEALARLGPEPSSAVPAPAPGAAAADPSVIPAAVVPPAPAFAPAAGPGGTVMVVYETGLLPPLEEVKIDLPVGGQLYSLAFPIYRRFGPAQPTLTVSTGFSSWTTARVLDIRAVAAKSLQERMPGMLTRGLAGALAKGEMQRKTEKEYGWFAGLAAKVTTSLLTQADLRSWLTLPAEIQVAQGRLAPGKTVLSLQGAGLAEQVPVEVGPGSQTFVLVRTFPGYRRVDVRTFPGPDVEFLPPLPAVPAATAATGAGPDLAN